MQTKFIIPVIVFVFVIKKQKTTLRDQQHHIRRGVGHDPKVICPDDYRISSRDLLYVPHD